MKLKLKSSPVQSSHTACCLAGWPFATSNEEIKNIKNLAKKVINNPPIRIPNKMRYRGGSTYKKEDVFEIDWSQGEEIPDLEYSDIEEMPEEVPSWAEEANFSQPDIDLSDLFTKISVVEKEEWKNVFSTGDRLEQPFFYPKPCRIRATRRIDIDDVSISENARTRRKSVGMETKWVKHGREIDNKPAVASSADSDSVSSSYEEDKHKQSMRQRRNERRKKRLKKPENAPLATSIDDKGFSELDHHIPSDTDPSEEKQTDQTENVDTVDTVETDKTMVSVESVEPATDYTEEKQTDETVETNNTIESRQSRHLRENNEKKNRRQPEDVAPDDRTSSCECPQP